MSGIESNWDAGIGSAGTAAVDGMVAAKRCESRSGAREEEFAAKGGGGGGLW